MMKSADLPSVIPVFPLPGALLLPRARLPLHIFEPRYLAMIEDCLKTPERLIGMIQPYEARGENGLHTIGCAGRLTAFSETEDGRYMVTLTGVSRFRMQSEVTGFAPYRRCEISWDGFERDLGTSEKDGQIVATGGRVLNVTARGDSLKEARDRAYAMIDQIDWPEGFNRSDIGWRAL